MQENNFDNLIEEMGVPEPPPMPEPPKSMLTKEEFAAKMKSDRDNLSEIANNMGTQIAGDSGKFQQYLNTLARFDRYSPQNTLMIFAQNPNAQKLGDYDYWKDMGTPVNKRQVGIKIFEPGKEYRRDDGGVGVSMNIKRVFDVSQTAARNKLQDTPALDIRIKLKALMSNTTAPIKLVDKLPDADNIGARYDEQRNVIEVVRGLDGESLFRCLSQEIAYATLDNQPTETLTCNDKGFAAYASSYVICKKNGIDTKGYSFSDTTEYFANRDGKEIRGEIKAIRDTVNDVAGRMAKILEPQQKDVRNQEAARA